MSLPLDLRVYLVTDRRLAGDRSLEDVVEAAVRGGVTLVQLREKDCAHEEFVRRARAMKERTDRAGVPLIINDDVEVAAAIGADGVHVGQSDTAYPDARERLGPEAIIGLTVEDFEQAAAAEELDVDYLGVSAIYATPTKVDAKGAFGVEGLRELRRLSRHRLVAIGGLDADNARPVVEAGADGIAVVSAICSASDPEVAARRLRDAVDRARGGAR